MHLSEALLSFIFASTIVGMRRVWLMVAMAVLAATAFCSEQLPPPPSKKDLKEAKSAFDRGMKLQNSKRLPEALQEFDSAVDLSPRNVEYLAARETLRQQLVDVHMQSGNLAMQK